MFADTAAGSNYETDLNNPTVAAAAKLAGLDCRTVDACQQVGSFYGSCSRCNRRSCCCVQILQRVPNNYETDLIYPIVAAAAKLAGLDYHTADARQQTSLKVCHHSRSQLISIPHKQDLPYAV